VKFGPRLRRRDVDHRRDPQRHHPAHLPDDAAARPRRRGECRDRHLFGIVFGLIALGVAVGVGSAALAARGIPITLDGGDYTLMPAGGIAAAALWAPMAWASERSSATRSQPSARSSSGSFVENLLIDFIPGAGKFSARRSGIRDHRTRP
jgi:hypothetical protein